MNMFRVSAVVCFSALALAACSPAENTSSASQSADKPTPSTQSAPAVKETPAKAEVPTPQPVNAAPAAEAPKPISGKRVYMRKTCMACHGRNGQRGIQKYPNIAGLDANYMRLQIRDIISGKRAGSADDLTGAPRSESMRGALVTAEGEIRISDAEIKAVIKWLAEQKPAGPEVHDPALSAERIALGQAAYKKAKCQTCHGADGNKPMKGYPRVAGQKSAYVYAQLLDMRDKVRTNSRSKLMTPFVKNLTDEEMAQIADYLSQIDPNQ